MFGCLYAWPMSQKLLVNGFKWAKETSQFKEDIIKTYNKGSDK